ncbi:hypothetical protein ACLVWU_00770 [Bdellovibrio sp. HCB290]|uniref:hypothetical protein n=1 Tax=Bdellovibrio sp. HCB290 TaxID=3394356 RepID=UPI0039B5AE4E
MFKASLTYKRMISLLTAFVVSFSSVSPAISATLTKTEDKRAKQDAAIMESAGYRVQVDYENKITRVFEKKSNIPVMEIPFADEQNLRKYSPKNIERRLLNDMGKVWTGNKAAFSHSLHNLAPESVMFFMSMGLVIAGQLVFNYSMNPVAADQHVAHSFSPMGIIGFQLFMYSQGAASNVLSMYMKNPKYHAFIPYLGMTVGATVQGIASQIVADPNVKACAKTWMGKKLTEADIQSGADADPCEKAYEHLVIHKKIWEMAPNITSMLISSAVAAGLEKGIVLGLNAQKANIIRMTGVDIVTWLMPGTTQVKGLRFLLTKGLKLSAFVALDQLFMRSVTYAWRNIVDAPELYTATENIEKEMNAMKPHWVNSYEVPIQSRLKTFREKMAAWRMANLADVHEASQNWQSALMQLTQGYKSAENFYGDFVQQARQDRFDRNDTANITLASPLNGVKADGMKAGPDDSYHNDPKFIEQRQKYTLHDAAAASTMILSSPEFKKMTPVQQKNFTTIVNGLGNKDLNKVVTVFNLMNSELRSLSVKQNAGADAIYYKLLTQVQTMVGNPKPQLAMGEAWVKSYVSSPGTYEKVSNTNYYRRVGIFATPQISDYFVMQMVCGPDVEKGQQTVRDVTGFPSVFLPPSIGNPADSFQECDPSLTQKFKAIAPTAYTWGVNAKNGSYNGVVSYLLADIRPSVLGTATKPAFDTWWKENTYSQMKKAFDTYSMEYDKIVVNLIRSLYKTGRILINAGPAYNGAMNAIFQEERVYLSILNDIMNPKPTYKLDFENILNQFPNDPLLKEVEAEFNTMNRLIKKIKIVTVDGRERVQSTLENSELEEQEQKIQAALLKVAKIMGASSEKMEPKQSEDPFAALAEEDDSAPKEPVIAQKFTLTKAQINVVTTVLESLQSLASEMKSYGAIANAVSWDKINNLKEVDVLTKKFNNMVQKQMADYRALSLGAK